MSLKIWLWANHESQYGNFNFCVCVGVPLTLWDHISIATRVPLIRDTTNNCLLCRNFNFFNSICIYNIVSNLFEDSVSWSVVTTGFSIEGPSQAKIDCHDNGDGSANISYFPFAAGEYAVHVLCDDEDIRGSPWMANIVPASDQFDPSKVCGLYLAADEDGSCWSEWVSE